MRWPGIGTREGAATRKAWETVAYLSPEAKVPDRRGSACGKKGLRLCGPPPLPIQGPPSLSGQRLSVTRGDMEPEGRGRWLPLHPLQGLSWLDMS